MSYVALSQSLPRCDNTKSTNYGSSFEMCTAAIVLLRCCKEKIDAEVLINDATYAPWDDLVLKYEDQTICFQLKHTGAVKKNKLKKCLDKRSEIWYRYPNLTFVYLTTAVAPDSILRLGRLNTIPKICNYFLTSNHVFYDSNTYFCTNQHDVAQAYCDIHDALQDLIGEEYASKDFLRSLQLGFKEFIRKRFYRLTEPDSTLTTREVCQHLGYAILSQFIIPYSYPANNHVFCKLFKEKLNETGIIVLNHRLKSSIKDNIWKYLVKLPRGKHHLGGEWSFGNTLHMPLFSPKKKTDIRILRALELMDYNCKVIILRPRLFNKDLNRTMLATLKIVGSLKFQQDDGIETLKYVEVKPRRLPNDGLHEDLFSKLARDFNAKDQRILEAHDESSYVNEEILVDKVRVTPLIAVIKTQGVDVRLVDDLIKRGANLNAVVSGGFTALYYAVVNDRSDIVRTLLNHGAKPDSVDRFGNTPLFVACSEGKNRIVELLLKHGSNRYAADAFGMTPIFRAYKAANYQILHLLLQGNKHPTAANAKGCHILHQAALDGDVECLKCVINSFPNLKVFMTGNAAGKNPLQIARENNNKEFIEIFKNCLYV
ncbi:hypothetical protein RN001_010890 [Aquatica leii]|uniref:Uncharacterized protein n=1 Tax=Aquatica leii TaxID=1421715 RepID=A0AAN7SGD1_9COLE|nr:hypothetical protein RN001_010890 [Aquatica leii]